MEQVLVYVVIINNRLKGVNAEAFSIKEAAISRAKEIAADWKASDGYEYDGSVDEGATVLYRYSIEDDDDYVCVIKRSLQ
jgi:hypothetical protein